MVYTIFRVFVDGAWDIANDPYRFALVNDGSGANAIQVEWSRTNDTNWHQVSVTYNGSSAASGVSGYEDGLAKSISIVANTLSATTVTNIPFQIGAQNGSNEPYSGRIDDVRIYSRALSASEIMSLYNESKIYKNIINFRTKNKFQRPVDCEKFRFKNII